MTKDDISLNNIQNELLSQIHLKRDKAYKQFQKYKELSDQVGKVSFIPRREITPEISEVKDENGKITQAYVPAVNRVVYDIRPQTGIAPIRDLTDDEIKQGLESIEQTFKSIN